jgi:hypothetical protein
MLSKIRMIIRRGLLRLKLLSRQLFRTEIVGYVDSGRLIGTNKSRR